MRTKLFLCIAIAVMAIAHTSCKKATYLRADKMSISMSRGGGTDTITLSSDVAEFSLEKNPEWADTRLEGNVLIVTVKENDAHNARSGFILVKASGMQLEIPIKQLFEATFLRTNPASINFTKEGGEQTVKVETDGEATVDAPDDLTATLDNGTLKVTVPANSATKKTWTITLTADDQKAEIAITQEASTCSTCNGTGKIKCSECNGKGHFEDEFGGERTCYTCGGRDLEFGCKYGTGKVTCPTCHGTGH